MRTGNWIAADSPCRGRVLLPILLVALLCACSEVPDPVAAPAAALDAKQLMSWIVDPSADVVWGSAGTITTADGVQDLAPTTQEGWDAVRNAAATLAEAGNVLQMPGHSRGEDWNEIAAGLTTTGMLLIDAATAQNKDQVFDYGGQLYNVCLACHQRYMLPETE